MLPQLDPTVGLFRRRAHIELPGDERERLARQLGALGLLHLEEQDYVRCVNPADPDQLDLRDRTCTGRIYVIPYLDEEDHAYHCPECDRLIFPSKKVAGRVLWLTPVESEVAARVQALIVGAGFGVEERPRGLFRVLDDRGLAEVCLVDLCATAAPLQAGYPTPVLFVVANDRDFLRRVPPGGEAYRLVDLVLGDAASRFQRRLRELVRGREAEGPSLPAVLGLPAPLGAPDDLAARPRAAVAPALQVPPGTRWNQVELYYIDGDTLSVRLPGTRAQQVTFKDLGLADGRGSKASKRWHVLVQLCEAGGQLDWSGGPRQRNAFKELVSQLRAGLQTAFGLHDNPLSLTAEDGLKAAFAAYPYAPGERPIEDAIDLEGEGRSEADWPPAGKSRKSTGTRPIATSRTSSASARGASGQK
ncbi:MAG: hypothetical protein RBU45_08405 [Myxococcota bacterium]|jgi:hypothetical protein|nr:hypothetical protein [Myxococcota bacterium]